MVSASYDAIGTVRFIAYRLRRKKKSWGHYDMGYLYEKFVEQASETFFPRTHPPNLGRKGPCCNRKDTRGRERHLCTSSYREEEKKARG